MFQFGLYGYVWFKIQILQIERQTEGHRGKKIPVPYFREHTNTIYIVQFIYIFTKIYLLTHGYTFFALRYGTNHGE